MQTLHELKARRPIASLHTHVSCNCRAYFALRMADQWLSWRLDMIASFLILIVAILAISERDHINPSLTAVSLTQVMFKTV